MRVFLFGSNGMLGNYLKSYLKDFVDLVPLTRNDFDISLSFSSVSDFLYEEHQITSEDLVINAAGVIKQRDFCRKQLITVNSLFPHYLAGLECNVIHITTDCVFSGLSGNYSENSLHDCFDDYGMSKSLGENGDLTIIRTSIIGEENHNKKSLLEWVRSNEHSEISGYANHYWNGVTCLELSKFIEKIIETGEYWKGVRHIFSPNTVNKFELVSSISEIYNLGITVLPIEVEFCDRSLTTVYDPVITKSVYEQVVEMKNFKLT